MSLVPRILGRPGRDNAVLLTVDSGDAVSNLLFDCGEGVLDSLRISQIQGIESLCFSHFHLDHVSGFDSFFRHNYNRPYEPVRVWGPPGTVDAMQHRFLSYRWNLHHGQPGEWIVREFDGKMVSGAGFLLEEAFEVRHDMPDRPTADNLVREASHYRMEMLLLPHGSISSVAYRISEPRRLNISVEALRDSGLTPGPWLKELTETEPTTETVKVGEQELSLAELRNDLVVESPGDSFAYLTDFRVEEGSTEYRTLLDFLGKTGTVVCECQYLQADRTLAVTNAHMTATEVGRLAADAGVGRLLLHHLSRRYAKDEWYRLLGEARSGFPRAEFPVDWNIA